jgi:hypothetical protein
MVRRLHQAISVLFEVSLLAIDVALLPIDYHTITQRLHLTPALPLFPAWSFVSPFSKTSFHATAWKPLLTSSTLERAVSPPALTLLTHRLLYPDLYNDDATNEERLSLLSSLTSFRAPSLTADPSLTPTPAFTIDPLGWTLYQSWSVRRKILHWTGFRAMHFQPQPMPLRRRATEDLEGRRRRELAASTASDSNGNNGLSLSLLLPAYFDTSFSALSSRLLALPVNAILLRGVAASFFQRFGSVSDAATGSALLSATPPFTTFSVQRLATFVSRIGLCLALHVVVDVGILTGLKWVVDRNTNAEFDAPPPPPAKVQSGLDGLGANVEQTRELNSHAIPADIWQDWRQSRAPTMLIDIEDSGDEVEILHPEPAPSSRQWQEWTSQLRESGRSELSGAMDWWRIRALDRVAQGIGRRFGDPPVVTHGPGHDSGAADISGGVD